VSNYGKPTTPIRDQAAPSAQDLAPGDCEAASIQQLQSDFIASITHEFRTPLAALNASVEFLLDEMADLDKNDIEVLLRSIYMSVTGLQTLIDNLLESSSIEAGMFSIRKRAVNISSVVNDALQVMQPLLLRRRQQISLGLADSLPPLDGDPIRIRQVLVNLLSNASKYGPINQTIEVRAAASGAASLLISVSDQGPGIPDADRDRLFKRFVRVYNQNGPQPGIGLGLAVVQAIVDAHGGQVGVDSAPHGGSRFWFTIPVYGATNESPDRG
jgi:signal transduction histidine kinase